MEADNLPLAASYFNVNPAKEVSLFERVLFSSISSENDWYTHGQSIFSEKGPTMIKVRKKFSLAEQKINKKLFVFEVKKAKNCSFAR
jgi:hypothetical protein